MRHTMILLAALLAVSAAAAANCTVTYDATNFSQFQAAVPQLNAQLTNCPIHLPPGTVSILGSSPGLAVTTNNAGYTLIIKDHELTGIEQGGNPSLVFTMTPTTFADLSTSSDKLAAFKTAYKSGAIWIAHAGVYRRVIFHIGWWFAAHFLG